MTISREQSRTVFKDLKPLLTGNLILPGDATYHDACQLWNGSVDKHPAALARCANAQDVARTVRWARAQGLALSVRGGGYDFAGRALCEQGIVIDCSEMRTVTIDAQNQTAQVQGGATVGDLIHAAQQAGLATAIGNVEGVGLAGLTLGGGYGPLVGRFGLVADNLLSAQVVTADGQIVMASADEHADLWWGLRGGGGNFGVVVSSQYRLYPLGNVLAGLVMYPLPQAREVLNFYREFIATAPDELTVLSGFFQMPDGTPILFFLPTYCGDPAEGERVLKPLRSFGQPLADQIHLTPITEINPYESALTPKGRHYFFQTQSMETLRPEAIEALVGMAETFTSPFSAITIHHFHGAASRVAVSETAFAPRQDHQIVEIAAVWESPSPEEGRRHTRWAQAGSHSLASYALPGGYVSLLGEDEQERVPLAFGPNYERLLALKRTYDPDDIFHSTVGHIAPTMA
jgi:FAD/FMN-containing dehydrogenase